MSMEQNVRLSPPWEIYRKKIEALLRADPEIRLDWEENTRVLRIFVNNAAKADALDELLPPEVEFGGVDLHLRVMPENKALTKAQLYRRAFEGNPFFKRAVTIDLQTNKLTYVVFAPEVVQFFGDNLGDINGNMTMVFEDVAKDVFGRTEGVAFCSDACKREVKSK